MTVARRGESVMIAGMIPVMEGVIVSTESVTRVRVTTGAVTVMEVCGGVTIDERVLVTVTGTGIELIDVVMAPVGSVLITVDTDIDVEIDTAVDTGTAEVRIVAANVPVPLDAATEVETDIEVVVTRLMLTLAPGAFVTVTLMVGGAKTPVVAVKGPLVTLLGGVVLQTGQQGRVAVVTGKSITAVSVVPLLKPPIPAKMPYITRQYHSCEAYSCLSYRVCYGCADH